MQRATTTGWRAPGAAVSQVEVRKAAKEGLFEACRLAIKVLDLAPSARVILDRLVGFYRGELIGGRMLVWPSNEALEDVTGLSERAVRYALRELLERGVISAKDSPNGKRFARKSARGQIIDAFGFDLSPLLHDVAEYRERWAELQQYRIDRKAKLDQITICRRQCQEWLIEQPSEPLETEFNRLVRQTPRRASLRAVDPALEAWQTFYACVESHYRSAIGGKFSRHKDTNNDTPDQSCYNGHETMKPAAAPANDLDLNDLLKACKDALAFTGPIKNPRELVSAAAQTRGAFGVNQDAWEQAMRLIGPLAAATTFLLVLQRHARPIKGAEPIKNVGGYFRALTRMVKDGKVDLAVEIHKFKGKR